MQPTKEWIKKWEKVKDKLQPNSNLVNYFTLKEIAGKEIDVMDIGPCSIPTGEFLVGDPLVYLGSKYEKEYFQKIPIGEFKTEVCVVKASDEDCDRYAAVRLKFNDNEISYFEEAMKGIEDLEDVNEGDFFGFNVDAGLACICDKKLHRDGGDWINWNIPNTNYHLPMFQSGFGDGAYPVYLAYDKDGNVCQLIVELIDIELAYSEIDEDDE